MQKKSILQISKEIGRGSTTVARLKKSYENYQLKINYNKAKNKIRLNREDDTWEREKMKKYQKNTLMVSL